METSTNDLTKVPEVAPPAVTALQRKEARLKMAEAKQQQQKRKNSEWIIAAIALFIGAVIGFAVATHRAAKKDVIVAVNGDVIDRTDLFNAMQDTIGRQMMQKLVQNKLQYQYAKSLGYAPTDSQVAARLKEDQAAPNYDLMLKAYGMTPGQFETNLPLIMAQEAAFSNGVTASDSDIQKFYELETDPRNPKDLFYRPAVATLQTIGTATLAQSQEALQKLQVGETFDMVAEAYSQDATSKYGGRIPPITFGQSPLHQYPNVERQLFNMQVGEQVGPIHFGNRWWIFHCSDMSPAVTIPLSEVMDQARRDTTEQIGMHVNGQTIKTGFATFDQTAKVQSFWPLYSDLASAH
jgi:parvulin-like peptidyl-prolyl isomerase